MPRPSKDLPGTPRKSRMRGRASVVRRSRKSHIRSPRRVTLAPIELPVRTRNWAIERLALVTIGFWPVMSGEVAEGGVECLRVRQCLAEADVDHDLRRDAAPASDWRIRTASGARERPRSCSAPGVGWSCLPLHLLAAVAADADAPAGRRGSRGGSRVGLPQLEQTSMTWLIGSGWAISRMPPCWICGTRSLVPAVWRGLVWRLAMLRPSTTTLTPAGRGAATEARLRRS